MACNKVVEWIPNLARDNHENPEQGPRNSYVSKNLEGRCGFRKQLSLFDQKKGFVFVGWELKVSQDFLRRWRLESAEFEMAMRVSVQRKVSYSSVGS
jgi:hypothetical protein